MSFPATHTEPDGPPLSARTVRQRGRRARRERECRKTLTPPSCENDNNDGSSYLHPNKRRRTVETITIVSFPICFRTKSISKRRRHPFRLRTAWICRAPLIHLLQSDICHTPAGPNVPPTEPTPPLPCARTVGQRRRRARERCHTPAGPNVPLPSARGVGQRTRRERERRKTPTPPSCENDNSDGCPSLHSHKRRRTVETITVVSFPLHVRAETTH
jgi:hypothetical protein